MAAALAVSPIGGSLTCERIFLCWQGLFCFVTLSEAVRSTCFQRPTDVFSRPSRTRPRHKDLFLQSDPFLVSDRVRPGPSGVSGQCGLSSGMFAA